MNFEPFQRTDISTQPLGPTILEVLNCGFHKTKGEKARYQLEEKNNDNSTIQATKGAHSGTP
jgi:hypothetical protein